MSEISPIFIAWFFLVVLATYRISFELAAKPGPFGLFQRWREYLIVRFASFWVEDTVTCPVCLSFWVSLVLCLVVFWGLPIFPWLVVWLAVGGIVVVIHYALIAGMK